MFAATAPQIDLITSLASQVTGRTIRFVSDADDVLPISKTAQRNLSKADASLCIEHLQRLAERAAAKAETKAPKRRRRTAKATPLAEGAEGLAEVLVTTMLNKATLEITGQSGRTYTGTVDTICLSDERPTVKITMSCDGRWPVIHLDRVASWRLI